MGFHIPKDMANFEAFCWVISSSINLLFLKSEAAAALHYYLIIHMYYQTSADNNSRNKQWILSYFVYASNDMVAT